MFFKVLWRKEPYYLFNSISNSNKEKVISLTLDELEKMSKLSRKSWKIRVLRYAECLPEVLFSLDPDKESLNSSLKHWINSNIEKDGDFIFKGKVRPPESNDWLLRELESWKDSLDHEIESYKQSEDIREEGEDENLEQETQ